MTFIPLRLLARAGCVGLIAPLLAQAQASSTPNDGVQLETVTVKGERRAEPSPSVSSVKGRDVAEQRSRVSDTARMLDDVNGVSVYGAGGISGLPAIHGLADDRLRVQVDGMDLMPACPNHMNSPLSYISPTEVGAIKVWAGITPVSVGGDSLGGTIQVESAPPVFADADEGYVVAGRMGAFYRSNGHVHGSEVSATWATEALSLSYRGNESKADNYVAGHGFKPQASGSEMGEPIPSSVVGSTAYRPINQNLALAWRLDNHLLQVDWWSQHVAFEGYPNQRMDMTDNQNASVNLRYRGVFDWGTLDVRGFTQHTHHQMDMGPDRYSYGTGMPMLTKADTHGGSAKVGWSLSDQDVLRAGAEVQLHTLYDWWPPVGGTMGPRAFWNVDYGRRDKGDGFVEWERYVDDRWTTIVGARYTLVNADAAAVQGYDNSLGMWGTDAARFNARGEHRHVDHNWDLTALARYTPSVASSLEFGFARKTRSPSLYQRYPWSTNAMAALMNNYVGDGNGYVGNEDLRPEVAHTLSVALEQREEADDRWGLKASTYLTQIDGYIDARRCNFGQCGADNVSKTQGFVLLQYVNQSAHLMGVDLSGDLALLRSSTWGRITGVAKLGWIKGENTTTSDGLYNIMPLNGKVGLKQRLGKWSHELEWVVVDTKRRVSDVRNEIRTPGYALANWRGSYEWPKARIDLGIENLFNRFYALPLGGAYVGQGSSMSTGTIPWGVQVPGMGRSLNVAVNLKY